MHDDTMLPDDDRDLSLARRIGERLDQHTPLAPTTEGEAPGDASFYEALAAFKQAQDEPMPADAAMRTWAALEQQIGQTPAARPAQPRPALRLVRTRMARLALAASVLLLAAVGWLLWDRTPAPVLLAAADTAIITHTMPDGSVVQLRPHSQLYALDADAAHYRIEGEGFFEVTKNENRTFTVEAGDARIVVLGTRFNVSTWGAQTAVYLEEGRIRFEHTPSQQALALVPGQESHAMPDGRLTDPAPADSNEYIDWLNQEMNFARRPLHRLLDELAQHFAVSFDVPAALRAETVTGRVLLDNIEQSLDDLGVILEGRFVPIDDETYRFVPN